MFVRDYSNVEGLDRARLSGAPKGAFLVSLARLLKSRLVCLNLESSYLANLIFASVCGATK